MTRTPAHRKKKGLWDRAIPAPRLTFGETEEKTCANPDVDCGHRGQVHEGWFAGEPKGCCYFEPGGRNKCGCKKFAER